MIRTTLAMSATCAALGACASVQPRDDTQGVLAGDRASLVALVFVATDCPIANAMVPEIRSLAAEAKELGIRFYAVHPAPGVDDAQVAAHAREFGTEGAFASIVDRNQSLARATGATVTPEGALLRLDGSGGFQRLYLGRVNNLYTAIGRRRAAPTEHDLRAAMRAAHDGLPIPHPVPKAVGCFIELSPSSR